MGEYKIAFGTSYVKEMLENYKTANDMFIDGLIKPFDIIIVKVLYPLFALVLGYIFGSNNNKGNNSSTE